MKFHEKKNNTQIIFLSQFFQKLLHIEEIQDLLQNLSQMKDKWHRFLNSGPILMNFFLLFFLFLAAFIQGTNEIKNKLMKEILFWT